MSDSLSGSNRHYENPDYGTGVFRRRIRLSGSPGALLGELEDCSHGFRVTVLHDGQRITDVRGEGLRIPLNTCAGAVEPIKALVGIAIDTDPAQVNAQVNPRANCTHLYDLSVLAIAHCARGNSVRQYDVVIPDETDAPTDACVYIDDRLALQWGLWQWDIKYPEQFVGKPMHRGFAQWVNATLKGEEKEAAFILQKGYLVAQARRYDMDRTAGDRAIHDTAMQGVCYSYSPGVVEHAYRLKRTVRDFTDAPEELLKFL